MNIPFIFGKKKEEVEEPTLTQEQLQKAIENSTKYLISQPNNNVEFITSCFDTCKHYKKLKRMIWKYGRNR